MLHSKRTYTILFLMLFAWLAGYSAQKQYSPKQALREAYYYYKYQNYGYALPYFEMYIKKDTANAKVNFDTGECVYYSQQDKTQAIPHYERAKTLKPEARLRLGELYHLKADFDRARLNYKVFLSDGQPSAADIGLVKGYLQQIDRAEEAMKHPTGAVITQLSDSINSKFPDYAPVLSPDGRYMFFTSRRKGSTGGIKDPNGDYFEDIMMSENVNGRWQKAVSAGKPLNSDTHDACLGITSNMHTMFIYRTNSEGTGGNIYESHNSAGKWSKPSFIEATFNSSNPAVKVVSLCVAPDSITYYYVSNAPGGYGGTDIYKVIRYGPNLWSKPVNLGPKVNTPEDEDSPFIHYDGRTMFFSSKGHGSYGSFDVFRTQLDTNGEWTKPVNMGYPVSTTNDNRAFVLMPDGVNGYLSSRSISGSTLHDIYHVKLAQSHTPFAAVSGSAKNVSGKPADIELKVFSENSFEKVGSYFPNTQTGQFVLLLQRGNKYCIEVWRGIELIEEINYTVPQNVDPLKDQITITLPK